MPHFCFSAPPNLHTEVAQLTILHHLAEPGLFHDFDPEFRGGGKLPPTLDRLRLPSCPHLGRHQRANDGGSEVTRNIELQILWQRAKQRGVVFGIIRLLQVSLVNVKT